MARVHPSLTLFRPTNVGQWGEYQVLRQLETGLPADFDVFHGVNWSTVHQGTQWFGEIDAVVLAPHGHMVLLEIKTGGKAITARGLTKRYGDRHKDVDRQMRQQYAAMRVRLQSAGLEKVRLSQFLVLLDARVEHGTASHPRERIIDAGEQQELCARVRTAASVPCSEPIDLALLRRLLEDRFDLAPDPTARLGQLAGAVQALSDGLATWVPRIRSASGAYQIQATAGAGKTQLALRLLRDAAQASQRARYVCFNRPLADHIGRIAPPRCEAVTFHELARTTWERDHGTPDFGEHGIFESMAAHFCAVCSENPPFLDLLIIDESQDFEPAWVEALVHTLKGDGRFYLMGDANQALYGRDPFDVPDATTVTVDENFRSPRAVVQSINLLGLAPGPIIAKCPIEGTVPGFSTYAPDEDPGGVKAVSRVVSGLLRDGYAAGQIALVTLAGQERSLLLRESAIAGLALRKYTGAFDDAGNPVWTDGVLNADSVMRFKGQAAPAVVLCEIDFEELNDARRRRLFVGFTRAQARLECVLTARAEAALTAGLGTD